MYGYHFSAVIAILLCIVFRYIVSTVTAALVLIVCAYLVLYLLHFCPLCLVIVLGA